MGRDRMNCRSLTFSLVHACINRAKPLTAAITGMMAGGKLGNMLRTFTAWGAGNMTIAVILGAFGAHALKDRLSPEMLDVYKTGAHYQAIHALGLILVAILADRMDEPAKLVWCGRLFAAGIVLFSGSLYALSLTGIKLFGAITPLGGLAFIFGWTLLTVAALTKPAAESADQ